MQGNLSVTSDVVGWEMRVFLIMDAAVGLKVKLPMDGIESNHLHSWVVCSDEIKLKEMGRKQNLEAGLWRLKICRDGSSKFQLNTQHVMNSKYSISILFNNKNNHIDM